MPKKATKPKRRRPKARAGTMARSELWMQRALRRKPGALHRQLGIPRGTKIPVTLMRTILDAETGDTIKNPTQIGKRSYKVTTVMQQRVNPVLTARRYRHKRGRVVH